MRRAAPSGQSKFARKNLRQKVECPDSSGGSDVVTYAYDTSGAQMWRKDQAGTIVETSFDAAGRREHERVTTLASGFDDAVRRITTAYDSTGRAQTVSSYDDATVGSGSVVNQVKSEWDGWGGLVRFAVDPDSAVDATGSTAPTKNVTYEYAKATSGRNTIRRTSATLAGATVTYLYGTGTTYDYSDEASRLRKMEMSSVSVAWYRYLGDGTVVGIDYEEPDVFQHRYGSTSGSYPDLDIFGRANIVDTHL